MLWLQSVFQQLDSAQADFGSILCPVSDVGRHMASNGLGSADTLFPAAGRMRACQGAMPAPLLSKYRRQTLHCSLMASTCHFVPVAARAPKPLHSSYFKFA